MGCIDRIIFRSGDDTSWNGFVQPSSKSPRSNVFQIRTPETRRPPRPPRLSCRRPKNELVADAQANPEVNDAGESQQAERDPDRPSRRAAELQPQQAG